MQSDTSRCEPPWSSLREAPGLGRRVCLLEATLKPWTVARIFVPSSSLEGVTSYAPRHTLSHLTVQCLKETPGNRLHQRLCDYLGPNLSMRAARVARNYRFGVVRCHRFGVIVHSRNQRVPRAAESARFRNEEEARACLIGGTLRVLVRSAESLWSEARASSCTVHPSSDGRQDGDDLHVCVWAATSELSV